MVSAPNVSTKISATLMLIFSATSIAAIGILWNPDYTSIISNSILASVALTSLYIAYRKLRFDKSHVLRINYTGDPPSDLEFVNSGKNPLTVRRYRIMDIISDENNEEYNNKFRSKSVNEVLEPAEKTEEYSSPAPLPSDAIYSKLLDVSYLDASRSNQTIEGYGTAQIAGIDYTETWEKICNIHRYFDSNAEWSVKESDISDFNANQFMKEKLELGWFQRWKYLIIGEK